MSSPEWSRKRHYAVPRGLNSAAKRAKFEWPSASPLFADHDTISNATSIRPIPSGVAIADNRPPIPTQFQGDGILPPTEQFEEISQYYPQVNSWNQPFLPQNTQPLAGGVERLPSSDYFLTRTNMYDNNGIHCGLDSCFGFTHSPRWAATFASLDHVGHESTNQAFLSRWLFPLQQMIHADLLVDGYSHAVEKSEKETHAFRQPITPTCSTDYYVFAPYSDNPPPYDHNSVTDELGGQFSISDGGLSLPAPQVSSALMPVETKQPLANVPHMAYPMKLPYQTGSAWGDGNRNNCNDQTDDFEDDGLDQSDDQEPESGAVDQPVRRDGGGPSKRRPFQKIQDRIDTAQTRKYKACLRCRMQKVRCNPDPDNPTGVCITCKNVSNLRVPSLGCLRYKVTDIRLFKPGQVPELQWTQRWPDLKLKDISEWASPERRKIKTTEGFTSLPLELEVRRFIPRKGDILERHWWTADRVKKSVSVPAFAIADIKAARKAYEDYINNYGSEFIMGCLKGKDELLTKTYSAAFEAASNPSTPEEEAKLLKMVLRLWTAVRITTRSIRICGEDTLDMPRDILDETSPLHGEIPVPPVLGTQIELILIEGIQKPLRKEVLHQLQRLISLNKPNTWFTLYLCTFILLHNCSMVTKYDTGYAKKYIPNRKYARPRVVEECHYGANVLLAYWHYRNKGFKPFTTENSAADFHAMSELKAYQTKFIKETSNYVQANATTWKSLKEKQAYGHDFYFVSQLYEHDWSPKVTTIIA